MKKGFFFSLAGLLMLIFLILAASTGNPFRNYSKAQAIQTRIQTLDSFATSLEEDLSKGLYIASLRALLGLGQKISTNGTYLDNAEAAFSSALINGTVDGTALALMENSTFVDWGQRIQIQSAKMGLITNLTITDIFITQYTPWEVTVMLNVSMAVNDSNGLASWRDTKQVRSDLSIVGLEDPLYTVETLGRIIRPINITPYEGNYTSGLDTTNLKNHVDSGYYTNSTGPSYLMRLEGNFSNSSVGIESFVNLPQLQIQMLPVYDRSAIDYVYFGNLSAGPIYVINETYEDWLRIDDTHLDKYQVRALAEPP